MSGEPQQIGSSLLSIEANVIIAGVEGIAVAWILYGIGTSGCIWLPATFGSSWSSATYAVYGVYGVLAIVIVGFFIEGLAGIFEDKVATRWACYVNTRLPEQSQQAMWMSDHAYTDFSRRRLRILVTRNTALCFVALTFGLACIFIAKCSVFWVVLALVAGTLISALFTYLWVDARRGWRNDIVNLGKIDPRGS